jgi:DNA-binding NtrC family response regulator
MRTVLLVEEHLESRASLAHLLRKQGYRVEEAGSGRAAMAAARKIRPHAILLDVRLPDMEGLAVLDAVLRHHPGLPAIVMSGSGDVDSAVEAMRRGAGHVATKPLDVDALLPTLERLVERAHAAGAVPTPASEAVAEMERLGIVARSKPMLGLFDVIRRVAHHTSSVLVLGESGTGKELVARALHALGSHATGPFVAVNCATLSEQMLENELFGHEKGAFTSADKAKQGVMELADHGTLFLDEVDEIGLACQSKLLRALERREFRRVGGTRKISVDVNLIAASNANLEECVERGAFRADLYFRIKVVTLTLPPLRERPDDIELLAERFLADVAQRVGVPIKRLSPESAQRLQRYAWPGNVRELRTFMESLTLVVPRPVIEVDDLPPNVRGANGGEIRLRVGMRMDEIEQEVIRRTLDAYPTVKDAARVLGISLRTLHERLGRYSLRRQRPKKR